MGLRRSVGLTAEAFYIALRDMDRAAFEKSSQKAEISGRYSRDPEAVFAFREIWRCASLEGQTTRRDNMHNFTQTEGKYKSVAFYLGENAKVSITLHRAGRPKERDYNAIMKSISPCRTGTILKTAMPLPFAQAGSRFMLSIIAEAFRLSSALTGVKVLTC